MGLNRKGTNEHYIAEHLFISPITLKEKTVQKQIYSASQFFFTFPIMKWLIKI